MNAAVVALVVVAVVAVVVASQARARRRASELKVSGGRKSLAMNLFGRS